jgi:hypothetical protein
MECHLRYVLARLKATAASADSRSKKDKEPEKKLSKLAAARAEHSQGSTADPAKWRYKVRVAECVEVVALGD